MYIATEPPTVLHDEASAGAAIASTAISTPAENHLQRRHPTDRLSHRTPLIYFSSVRALIADKVAEPLLFCQGGRPAAGVSVFRPGQSDDDSCIARLPPCTEPVHV